MTQGELSGSQREAVEDQTPAQLAPAVLSGR